MKRDAEEIVVATMRLLPVLITALAVSACATSGGTAAVVGVGNLVRNAKLTPPATVISVGIPRHSANAGRSALASIAPATLRALPFNDDRDDPDSDGQTSAAFGIPMARIRFEPSPATLLGQAVAAEMRAAGHLVTDAPEGALITGSILEFEAHTATTPLYWDVIGTLAVALQVQVAGATTPQAPLVYQAQCSERTYIWPGESVIAAAMGKCVNDFASQLRNDGRVSDALGKLATKEMTAFAKVEEVLRSAVAQSQAAAEKSYTHPDGSWSVSYPADWNLDANDGFVKISSGPAILGIHTLSTVTQESLDEVADSAIKAWEHEMQEVNVVRRISRQRMTLAGGRTAIAIVHHIGAGQVGKSRKIIVAVQDRRYLIDAETLLTSWPDYEPGFNRMIDSFVILQ